MHDAVIASLNWRECQDTLSFHPVQGVIGSLSVGEPTAGALKVHLQYHADAARCERLQGTLMNNDASEALLTVVLARDEGQIATLTFDVLPGPAHQDLAVGVNVLAGWLTYAVARHLGRDWLLQVQSGSLLQERVVQMAELAAASVEPCAFVLLEPGN